MKTLLTALFATVLIACVSGVALAQPASESGGASAESAPSSPTQKQMMGGPMMRGGMMHGGMMGGGMEPGGCGMMGMHRMYGMEMMPMMMGELKRDPKLMGRMMELRGEMMRTMGQALIDRGKQIQQGGGQSMRQNQ